MVAATLKLYFRELPEPLLTFDLYDHFIACGMNKDHTSRLQTLHSLIRMLTPAHFETLRYLCKSVRAHTPFPLRV